MKKHEQSLQLHLYSIEGSYSLEISPVNYEATIRYAELVSIFGHYEDGAISVQPEHVMNGELRQALYMFCSRYRNHYPILNRFQKAFSKIPDGKLFFILPRQITDTAEVVCLYNYMRARNMNMSEEGTVSAYNNSNAEDFRIFGPVFEHYHINAASSDTRTHIGASHRNYRVCRFCGKSTADPGVTFRKVAHAIPEALGNKGLILNEECDTCNETFGNTIEPDLIAYFNFYRVFWGIKGKNGLPRIKFKNGCIAHKEGRFEIGYKPGLGEVELADIKQVTLYSHRRIATANIYKSLCKIALSVMENDKLGNFGRTISWLISEEGQSQVLPRIAVLNAPQMRAESPQIVLYERKNVIADLPHLVAEFKFKTLVFVFIVPFSDLDSKTFFSDEEYSRFWQSFPHYAAVDGWSFERFDNPQRLNNSLTVVLNKSTFLRLCEDDCSKC